MYGYVPIKGKGCIYNIYKKIVSFWRIYSDRNNKSWTSTFELDGRNLTLSGEKWPCSSLVGKALIPGFRLLHLTAGKIEK